MEIISVEEFQWSLKRLLREGFPQGIPLEALSSTYNHWLDKAVDPKSIGGTGGSGSKNWRTLFKVNDLLKKTFKITKDEVPLVKLRMDGNETSLEELREVLKLVKYPNVVMMRVMESYCMEESNNIDKNQETVPTVVPPINSVQSTETNDSPIMAMGNITVSINDLEPVSKDTKSKAIDRCPGKHVQTETFQQKRKEKSFPPVMKNDKSSDERLGLGYKLNLDSKNDKPPACKDLVTQIIRSMDATINKKSFTERLGCKRKHDGDGSDPDYREESPPVKHMVDESEDSLYRRIVRVREYKDDENENVHPLLNESVLETLFSHVQRNDLLTCRIVCKRWNYFSLPFVRSKLWVEIVPTIPSYYHTRGIVEFMKMIRSNTLGIPFENYSLGSFDMTEVSGEQFLQMCGRTVKRIILLNDPHVYNVNSQLQVHHVIQNVSLLLRSTPNLMSLIMPDDLWSKFGCLFNLFDNKKGNLYLPFLKYLDAGRECPFRRRWICPKFYEGLFEAAPNISTVNLRTSKHQIPNATLDVLQAIKKHEKSIRNLSLPHMTDDDLCILRSMSTTLYLKQLELTDVNDKTEEFPGFELIKIFKDTLIVLRVICTDSRKKTSLLPFLHQMPKLRFLQLRLNFEVSVKCGSFNNIFPALEKIDIDFNIGDYFGNTDKIMRNIFISNQPCSIPTLKSSIISCLPIKMERLERILTIFPTLKILKCKVRVEDGAEVIKNIWTRMSQLEGLSIYGNIAEDLDNFLTGIPFKEIKSKLLNLKVFFESLQHLETKVRRKKIYETSNLASNAGLHSIRNLTNLRSLELKLIGEMGETNKHVQCLTDVTGYFGFYSLKNLQHLKVSNCELSKSCAEILVNDKNLRSWKSQSTGDDFRALDIIPRSLKQDTKKNQDEDEFPLQNV